MVYSIVKRQLSRRPPARVQAHNDCKAVENLRYPNRLWQIVISTQTLKKIYTTTWKAGGDCEIRMSDATTSTYFTEKLDPERCSTTQLNYRNKVYRKPKRVQEAFEFLNSLIIPKKNV